MHAKNIYKQERNKSCQSKQGMLMCNENCFTYLNNSFLINGLNETFKQWLDWMMKNKIHLCFPYGRWPEMELRELCKEKNINGQNILRHTAITYHLLNFKETILTSKIAGTSLAMIERHYLSKNIPTLDSERLYSLTPSKAKELSIII